MTNDPLAPLKARFRERCGDDASRLRAHLAGAEEPELEGLIHRLAGSARMFGHAEIGAMAEALDADFAEKRRPTEEALSDLAAALERLATG